MAFGRGHLLRKALTKRPVPLIKLLGENYAKGFVRGFAKKDCKADSAS